MYCWSGLKGVVEGGLDWVNTLVASCTKLDRGATPASSGIILVLERGRLSSLLTLELMQCSGLVLRASSTSPLNQFEDALAVVSVA